VCSRACSPWDDGSDSVANAKKRVDAAFEFFDKLGASRVC
jgi:xylose isomerase